MEPTGKEVALSRVACLLDELAGQPLDPDHWRGFHPKVYPSPPDGDALVAELCRRLQATDVSRYSLEMQMWWRDHRAADAARSSKT